MAEVYKRCCGLWNLPEPWKVNIPTMWVTTYLSFISNCVDHIWSSENVPTIYQKFCATSVCPKLIGEWLPQFQSSHQRVQKPQKILTQESYSRWMDRLACFECLPHQPPTYHLSTPCLQHPYWTPCFQVSYLFRLPGLTTLLPGRSFQLPPRPPRF